MSFNEKIAIVTGAARGIGRAIAEALAKEGCKVVIADVAGALDAAAEMKSAGFEALGLEVDVTNAESVKSMVSTTLEHFGRLDILINNAGITRDGLLMRMKEQDWDLVLSINLKGAFNCCKAACRALMKSPAGRIVNIASVVGLIGNAGQANYSASKAGLIGLTKTLAKEFASRGVTVNAIAPGFIETAMTNQMTEEAKARIFSSIPLGTMGRPADVAAAVQFLASDQAAYVTGHVLCVDGGMAM